MKILTKYLVLYNIGGFSYIIIEFIFRYITDGTDTHWTMFILGGLLFILLGLINEFFSWEMRLPFQCLIGTVLVTIFELCIGYLLNIKLNLNIWNYQLPLSFFNGQINLLFSLGWYFLSAVAIIADDYLRYYFFNEEKPIYRL